MNQHNERNWQHMPFQKNTGTSHEVELNVVFGSPGKNCEGIGICRMLESKYMAGRDIKCPHVPGFLSLDAKRHLLSARFPKRFLTSQMVARHFCKKLFKVTESYRVPARFARALGVQQSIQITEGSYQVVETEEDLIIAFQVGSFIFLTR